MINIIKSDLYRIFKGKAIYVLLTIIVLIISPQIIFFKTTVAEIISGNNDLYFAFIVIIVSVILSDFSNSTIKNTIACAITKKTYYFSKLISSLFLSTLLIIFFNCFTYSINIIVNGIDSSIPIFEFMKMTVIQLPPFYGIISLLICLAFIFKKPSIFNAISISYPVILEIIINIISMKFKVNVEWYYKYQFIYSLENLINKPTNKYIMSCAVLGIAYIIVFNIIGYYSFKKAEIK
ncbi:MAG: hypothetical protein J6A89_05995 [Clostridia bacterium]|nr:hypothetical protein [Clostridia bacterium]